MKGETFDKHVKTMNNGKVRYDTKKKVKPIIEIMRQKKISTRKQKGRMLRCVLHWRRRFLKKTCKIEFN